jgi:tRNA modification GTPase
MSSFETIYALSSAVGQAGVAVVRLSGLHCGQVLSLLTKERLNYRALDNRKALLTSLYDPCDKSLIDSVLVLPFHAPHSFTGEDVLEIQCHGSRAVLKKLFHVFSGIEGLRPAQAGEFSRRAFMNEKMDMVQVEGLLDLIHAETEQQRRFAVAEYGGDLSHLFEKMRSELIDTQAFLEAGIDFADEEIPQGVFDRSCETVHQLQHTLQTLLNGVQAREKIRQGFKVAIIGAPNAGKSTLMNALTGRDMAIVSEIAGTTRDTLEAYLDFEGFPVTLLDTAGLRLTQNSIEQQGILRAKHHAHESDVVLYVMDGDELLKSLPCLTLSALEDHLKDLVLEHDLDGDKTLFLMNKQDLLPQDFIGQFHGNHRLLVLSAQTQEGVETVKKAVYTFLQEAFLPQNTGLLLRERYVHHLNAIQYHLTAFLKNIESNDFYIEILAEELRAAANEFSKISGRIHIEQVYDKIFSSFCIGK